MSPHLTCTISPRIDVVSPEAWRRLFPELPDSLEMIQLVQRCGMDGFTFHSILIRDGERPILLLPLFETRYSLSTFVESSARRWVDPLTRWWPRLLRPRVLGVGFVEGEWSQVGVEPDLERAVIEQAWDMALASLTALADGLDASLVVFVNFTSHSGRMLPLHKLRRFTELVGLPYAQLPIRFPDTEAYIAGLSVKMRSDLRRKLRQAHQVAVRRTRDVRPWINTIYRLYRETVSHGDVVFGMHRPAYFEQVCDAVPGAEYWLYFVDDQLLAFKLVVVTPHCLIDKYFGMDHTAGRIHNLYFLAWVELIRFCIDQRIPLYHASQAEEHTKARLGANLFPSAILFQHRQPLIHRILTQLSRTLSYAPQVALPKASLGTDWQPQPSPGLDEAIASNGHALVLNQEVHGQNVLADVGRDPSGVVRAP